MNFRIALLLLGSFWAHFVWGQQQNGWDLILSNDYRAARTSFTQAVAADSSDQQSMLGLLYLAEIFRDQKLQEQLSEYLLLHAGEELYFRTLNQPRLALSQIEDLLKQDNLSPSVLLPYQVQQIKYESWDSYEAYSEALQPYFLSPDWYFIGPFRNIGGSGYDKVFGPETSLTQIANQPYDNGVGKPIRWIQPQKQDPAAILNPEDRYLPENRIGDLYYLHKRFSLSEQKEVILELGRSEPIKIWLDGQAILEDPDGRGLEYSGERIRILLSAGQHDLRIKISPYNPNIRQYEEFSFLRLENKYNRAIPSAGVSVRLVDEKGRLLQLDKVNSKTKQGSLLEFETLEDQQLVFLKSKLNSEDFRWSDYYLLARLLLKKQLYQEGVEIFSTAVERYPESIYLRSFLAMFHGQLGNFVYASRALERMDLRSTPFYSLCMREMSRLNAEIQRTQYLEWLDLLQEVSPSNEVVIRRSVQFYRQRNWTDTLDTYKERTLESYPDYEHLFRESNAARGKGEKEKFSFKEWRTKQKVTKARKKAKENPLPGLEEAVARYPYVTNKFLEKARYHQAEKEFAEAHQTLDEGLLSHPSSRSLFELKGDIYKEQAINDSARLFYERARNLPTNRYYGDEVSTKLKSLRAENKARDAFQEVSFEDILKEEDVWKAKYAQENIYIPLRTVQILIDTNGQLEVSQKMLMVVNTINGVRAMTQVNFSYLGENVSIKVVRPDGTEFRPEQNGNFAVFKDLKPGDRIYAEGTASGRYDWSQYPFGDHWMHWHSFMLSDPVYHTYLEIGVPQGGNLPYVPYRLEQDPSQRTQANYDFYRWELNELPRLKEEEAGFADWFASPAVWLSNESDWSKYVSWYEDLTYRKLDPTPSLQKLYDELVVPGMSDEEKLIAFYTFVSKEINYSMVPFLQSNFEPQSPDLTCSARIGDCKDVATLMIALLRMAGIESYYALTQAGQYMPFEPLPQIIFNHVVVAYVIDGEMRYVDPTTDRFPYTVLPEMDCDGWALLIKEGEDRIFRLPDTRLTADLSKLTYTLDAKLEETGSVSMKVEANLKGVEGARYREMLSDMDQSEQQEFLRRELNVPAVARPNFAKVQLLEWDDINVPLGIETSLEGNDFAEALYDLRLLSLPLIVEASLPEALLQEERLGQLDLAELGTLVAVEQALELTIPEGYRLYQVPEDVYLESPFGEYQLKFERTETGLRVWRSHQYKQAIVDADEYEAFRDYYFQRYKHDHSKLVLVVAEK